MGTSTSAETLKRTPLYDLHVELGGKMVPFAGYDMPVQYPPGIIKEHLHTRAQAGLFDISHMGQVVLEGGPDPAARPSGSADLVTELVQLAAVAVAWVEGLR